MFCVGSNPILPTILVIVAHFTFGQGDEYHGLRWKEKEEQGEGKGMLSHPILALDGASRKYSTVLHGAITLIGKGLVLKTNSSRRDAVCGFESLLLRQYGV